MTVTDFESEQLPDSSQGDDRRPAGGLARNRRFVILGGLLLVALVAAVIITLQTSPRPENTNANQEEGTGAVSNTSGRETFQRYPTASQPDQDGDGLTDAAEAEHGTSATLADTDGDGLTDREEVEVYATNPTKQDTDGDGSLDGQEVAAGQNPNGPGLLRDLTQAIQNLNQ